MNDRKQDGETPESAVPSSTIEKSYNGDPDNLHDLFAGGEIQQGEQDDPLAALRDDPNYAALIRDLEYIAKQARLLFEPAAEAPSDEVWTKIQSQLGKPTDA